MKKRLFAGALALLMIIGLLPVSSMLKKPVEAQAANSNVHTFESNKLTPSSSFSDGEKITSDSLDSYFEIYASTKTKINSSTKEWKDGYSSNQRLYFGADTDLNNMKNCIKFTTSGSAKIKVWWAAAKAKRTVSLYDSEKKVVSTDGSNSTQNDPFISEFTVESAGTYYLGGNANYLFKVEVSEATKYTININDQANSPDSQPIKVEEGKSFDLEAKGENFLYWETSHGRIVSRVPSTTLTAYYNETYTAVYGSDVTVYYMTAYNQIYKSVASNDFDSSSEQPAGPIRYGYKFTGWNKSASDIQTEIESGTTKKIFVDPKYDQDTTTKYTVTVDTTALTDDKKSVDTEYTINDVATASTSSAEFAYWKDAETGKVLSYNSTYYFFANKDMKVVAVNKSEATSDSEGVISLVFNGTNDDGDSVVIFEYTVPSDCTVKFAGVYASPDSSKLTKDSADFVDGGVFNSKNTYKYTITKTKGMSTWYVMPVLEYTDSNGETVTKTLSAETF